MTQSPSQLGFSQRFATHRGESLHPELWDGLMGMWAPALGPTGNTLLDYSGNVNHGTFGGTVPPTWTTSQYGWCLNFAGTSNNIALARPIIFSPHGTVVAKCFRTTDNNDRVLASGASYAEGYWFTGAATNRVFCNWGNSYREYVVDPHFNSWVCWAATRRGTACSLYRDGKYHSTQTDAGNTGTLRNIGSGYNNPAYAYRGYLSVFAVWDRVLADSDIKLLADDPLAMLRAKRRVTVGGSRPVVDVPHRLPKRSSPRRRPPASELVSPEVIEDTVAVTVSGVHADALRLTIEGVSIKHLSAIGTIPGVVVLSAAARNGPGVGAIRSEHDGTWLAYKAPGSATWGTAWDCGVGGTALLEDGEDRDKWIRIHVYPSYLLPTPNQSRIVFADRYENGIGDGDVTAEQATDGDTVVWQIRCENHGVAYLSQLRAWLESDATGIEISADGNAWSSPSSEGEAISIPDVRPSRYSVLWVRRTIESGSQADPRILRHMCFSFSGL